MCLFKECTQYHNKPLTTGVKYLLKYIAKPVNYQVLPSNAIAGRYMQVNNRKANWIQVGFKTYLSNMPLHVPWII